MCKICKERENEREKERESEKRRNKTALRNIQRKILYEQIIVNNNNITRRASEREREKYSGKGGERMFCFVGFDITSEEEI